VVADRAELAEVTPNEALAHPTWDMGPVITINSATLMNKALELIEAHELFDVPWDRLDVVVHPQSVVHSMVEFVDGSTIAQLSPPDMRLPIQLALAWPDRLPARVHRLRLDARRGADLRAGGPRHLPLRSTSPRRPVVGGAPSRRSSTPRTRSRSTRSSPAAWVPRDHPGSSRTPRGLGRTDPGQPADLDDVLAADRLGPCPADRPARPTTGGRMTGGWAITRSWSASSWRS
jgi:1-deoxy-D-xylulose-5-phosphate reductoisomerase